MRPGDVEVLNEAGRKLTEDEPWPPPITWVRQRSKGKIQKVTRIHIAATLATALIIGFIVGVVGGKAILANRVAGPNPHRSCQSQISLDSGRS